MNVIWATHERDPAQDTGLAYHTLRGEAQLTLIQFSPEEPKEAPTENENTITGTKPYVNNIGAADNSNTQPQPGVVNVSVGTQNNNEIASIFNNFQCSITNLIIILHWIRF